ncbi:MAG: hypothetical protein KF753_07340 [Caldilineaceae bacterium]|nr:hypothetical protein [Caldilineaceae bacterium]
MSQFHKFGFHVNRTGDDVLDAIRRLKPRVIKSMESNIDFWKRVREMHPDVFLIGRDFVPQDRQNRFVDDPAGIGRAYAERVLRLEANNAHFNGRPLFDAWESYNEVMPGHASTDEKRKYDEFQVAFGERLRAGGFEPIAMNFATGNMRGKDFLDHFAGTLEVYKYLGFHEYDWPDLWRLHKSNIEEKGEEGMWLALRYRRTMDLEGVRAKYGNKHTVIITECGMTQGVSGGEDVGPWHESHPVPEEQYWRSLLWYNNELMRDEYVMAACLFVVGAVSPWHSFEHLGGVMKRLEKLDRSGPDQPIPQPVPPEKQWHASTASGGISVPPVISPQPPTKPETPPAAADSAANQRVLRATLVAAGRANQSIDLNPKAAIQQRIFADGFVPTSPEFSAESSGRRYVGQQAEHPRTGEVRVYYAPEELREDVKFVGQALG